MKLEEHKIYKTACGAFVRTKHFIAGGQIHAVINGEASLFKLQHYLITRNHVKLSVSVDLNTVFVYEENGKVDSRHHYANMKALEIVSLCYNVSYREAMQLVYTVLGART